MFYSGGYTMIRRFLILFTISLYSFNSIVLPTPLKKSKVVITNESDDSIAVNTVTIVPSQTKAVVATTLTNLPPKSDLSDIQMAIILKDIAKINQLLQSGFIPNDKTIAFAMDNGLPGKTIVSLVQKAGRPLNLIFSNGMTLKQYAIEGKQHDIDLLIYLIENNVSFHDCAETIDCAATSNWDNSLKLISAFLKKGYGPDFILKHSCFIHNMIGHDKDGRCLSLLLKFGLDPNTILWSGSNQSMPLICFFMLGNNTTEVRMLIAYGVKINQKISPAQCPTFSFTDSITPLSFALLIRKSNNQYPCPELDNIINLLVKHGAIL